MATRGKTVVRESGKRGLLAGGKGAIFNSQDDCRECCCNPTDVLIVTCNANRVTDDDYTVELNGHVVGNVAHVGGWPGCDSPGTGLWACSDPSITPATLTNLNATLGQDYCQVCVEDDQWTFGSLDPDWLQDSNDLLMTGTSSEGCGDWGVVSVWTVDAAKKKLCRPILQGQYVGWYGTDETMFSGTFEFNPLP